MERVKSGRKTKSRVHGVPQDLKICLDEKMASTYTTRQPSLVETWEVLVGANLWREVERLHERVVAARRALVHQPLVLGSFRFSPQHRFSGSGCGGSTCWRVIYHEPSLALLPSSPPPHGPDPAHLPCSCSRRNGRLGRTWPGPSVHRGAPARLKLAPLSFSGPSPLF